MEIQIEIEALEILEQALAMPTEERKPWLEAQALKATTANRVRALMSTASNTGSFLETPATLPLV